MATYKSQWYEEKRLSKVRSAREVVSQVLDLVHPQSVVDVGCGDGTWLSVFAEHDPVETYLGIDGEWIDSDLLQIPREHFQSADLTKRIDLDHTYDLAVSLEVAEHLPSSAAKVFVETLTSLSPVVLFSAAVPYQGGTHHVNEQWQKYWAERFKKHKYVPINTLRRQLWTNKKIHDFYRQNLILYVHEEHLEHFDVLSEDVVHDLESLSIVHPALFERKMKRCKQARHLVPGAISLRDVIRGLPRLIYSATKRRVFGAEEEGE